MSYPQPTILLETPTFLAINKPAGLVVHPDGKRSEYSLVDWIFENYPGIAGVGEPLIIEHGGEQITIDRPGIVHRLDRETSGVLLIAKTQESYENLKQQFQDHTIRKQYLAIVSGKTDLRGIIDTPIGRSARDIRRWTVGTAARGMLRPAVTSYVTEKTSVHNDHPYSLVRLYPETGRTHQLRVHMKSIQRPIIGDGIYAPSTVGMLGFNRTALHAQSITFKDLDGKEYTVEAPLPDDFIKNLDL